MKMKRSRCEYTGWIVAWIVGIIAILILLDDIRLSKIVIDYENKKEVCSYGR